MEIAFWVSCVAVLYAYLGYPLVLFIAGRLVRRGGIAQDSGLSDDLPSVTLLIPAHNEASVIGQKIDNALSLEYGGPFQILVVSDGSTDATAEIVRSRMHDKRVELEEIPSRGGKAVALDRGIELAKGEIIVFTDASIMLEPQALLRITRPFRDPSTGCVSGEDRIAGVSGEGLYGRYELFLRRQESLLGSLVGASGSFYAQRQELVSPFSQGLAPDFLSVLNTVRRGYRAVAAPDAMGWMEAVTEPVDEFRRKVRTAVRGMTALFHNADLLNPLRFPLFSFFLWSHKILRWAVPLFLIGMFVSSAYLSGSLFYGIVFVVQAATYAVSVISLSNLGRSLDSPLVKIVQFFVLSNTAMLVAWFRYIGGFRQEIWGPSKRNVAD